MPLSLRRWLRKARSSPCHRRWTRPCLEALEGRCLPSTVMNLADSGPGSLRDAIASTPAGGTVDFQPGLSGTITLSTGELLIDKNLTIAGPGSSVITVSGNHASRVFDIAAPETVAISGLTIADGSVTDSNNGGGILNDGTLALTDCTLSGNSAAGRGGGIYNDGTLSVTNSTLSGNSAVGSGGGINNFFGTVTVTASTISGNSTIFGGGIYSAGSSGTVTVTVSTISGNSASGIVSAGGGIDNIGSTLTVTASTISGNSSSGILGGIGGGIDNSGTVTIISSTISGNSANSHGGGISNAGISNAGSVTVTNSTFSGNSASDGGGIENDSGGTVTVTNSTLNGNSASISGGGIVTFTSAMLTALRNTIVAGNNAPTGPDISGTLDSQGYNLIGIGDGGSGYADTDLVGTSDFPIDPLLQPLGDYGGPTQTMPPLPNSPVINAGDNIDAPDTDQRGFPRIVLGFIDIGAVELQPSEFGGPGAAAVPPDPTPLAAPPAAMTPPSRLDTLFQLLGGSPHKHAARLAVWSSVE